MDDHPVEILKLPVEAWRDYKTLRLEALRHDPQAYSSRYDDQRGYPDSFWQSRLADAAQGEHTWLLFARSGESLVGLVGAFREEDDPLAAHVVSVYVSPEARGRGISRRLMQALLAELAQAGIKKATLGVNTGQAAATHLYRGLGFTTVRTERQQVMGDGKVYDEDFMEKWLTA